MNAPRLAAVLCCCLLVPLARAQQPTPLDARTMLRADVRPRLLEADDSLLALRSVRLGTRRVEAATGIVRADYRLRAPLDAPPADPADAARRYLQGHAARYGLDPSLADLRVVRVVSGRYSHHVTFAQTVDGVPVYGRAVQVNLDADRQPLMVTSAYDPALRAARLSAPRLTGAEAEAAARGFVQGPVGLVQVQDEVVVPVPVPRRAWRVAVEAAGTAWEFLVDAETGAALLAVERSTHGAHGTAAVPAAAAAPPFYGPAPPAPLAAAQADGTGYVFDPDPLTTAGAAYGGAFSDNNDADTPELNAQRRLVTLRDLTVSSGRYTLAGPYVRIVGDAPAGGQAYTPPEETSPDGFRYTRAQDGFEAVMVYYHADAAQRHVQALDVGRPVLAKPQRINPHGLSTDDSRFYPTTGLIAFGTGAVDDAEDADVIWHEYAHALLHDSQPALYQAVDGTALHEGWADYWAGSYSRALLEAGQGTGDWRQLFQWDGNNGCWQGRRLDHPGHYPDQTAYPPIQGCLPLGTLYQKGLLWATTLMEVYTALGRDVTDRLNVASHAFLGAVTSAPAFEVAAEALLAADQALYGGANRAVLLQILGARGYVDAAAYGPTVAHTPLTSTEQVGGTRLLTATVHGTTAAVTQVAARYRVDGGAEQMLALDPQGGDGYAGALPIPSAAATITYFIEAVDAQNRTTRLPASAGGTFTFTTGPDTQPPVLAHTARVQIPLAAWPPVLTATATDNLGVDTVEVRYEVFGADGVARESGRFGLAPAEGDLYRGTWPVAAAALDVGSTVRYEVVAQDVAQQPNTARLPTTGRFEIEIVAQGVLAAFDFEADAPDVTATGVWARGTPGFGLQAAHTGTGAWMTGLAAAYPAERSASYLTLPPLDLRGDAPRLVFWHWYDTERGGSCGGFCDGGVVEVSTDGGATWAVTAPAEGYPGQVGSATGTALAGQDAWGGYSYGWQRAVVPLPALPDVRVRFAFVTDAGNVEASRFGYAGWAVDDVTITTLPPDDVLPPFVESTPPAVVVQPAGAMPAPFVVEVQDETGVARVEVRYTLQTAAGAVRDTLRLEQLPTDLTRFTGTVLTTPPPAAGDGLTYTLYAEDADGNAVTYPEAGAYEIHFRTLAQVDALAGARPTGAWTRSSGPWVLVPDGRAAPRDALVLAPADLPANAETMQLRLHHRFHFDGGAGGNVKASADGGRTWQVLVPETGYPARLAAPGHPMDGEGIFAGPRDTLDTVFDLSAFAGQQLRLRFEVGAARALQPGEFWALDAAVRYAASADSLFETPRRFALHAAFPNPFTARTTFTYTLAEAADVRLEVYDVLGRRVALLVDGETRPADTYTATFDATTLAGGVYFVRLTAGTQQQTRQVVVLR